MFKFTIANLDGNWSKLQTQACIAIVLQLVVLLTVGCLSINESPLLQQPAGTPSGKDSSSQKGGISTQSTNYFTYTAGWHTWWQNTSGGATDLCDASKWSKFPYLSTTECRHFLRLARWGNGGVGNLISRAYMALDFDTSGFPDSWVVTAATLRLNVRGITVKTDQSEEPEPLACEDSTALATSSNAGSVGVYWGGVPSLHYHQDSPAWTLTDICDSMAVGSSGHQSLITGVQDVPALIAPINNTGVTRVEMDWETFATDYFIVVNIDGVGSAYQPRLKVTKYYVPFSSTCLDGVIEHATSNCTSCSSGDFSTGTSGASGNVGRDLTAGGDLCGESQAVLAFNTAELMDDHTITSATLGFYVNSNVIETDVSTKSISIYGKTEAGSCPTSIAATDFNRGGCASGFTSLGTVSVSSTGAKTFTISSPNSYISKTGITKFVLIDGSTFSSSEGSVYFSIAMNENSTSSRRPKLTVTYE